MPADVRAKLVAAFLAADAEAAWYLDREEPRVVRVRRGATDVPDLSAEEVLRDELRYVEIPVVTEVEVHGWMEDFVEERGNPVVARMLDGRKDANRRFLESLAARDPAALADWNAFRARRLEAEVDAWLAE